MILALGFNTCLNDTCKRPRVRIAVEPELRDRIAVSIFVFTAGVVVVVVICVAVLVEVSLHSFFCTPQLQYLGSGTRIARSLQLCSQILPQTFAMDLMVPKTSRNKLIPDEFPNLICILFVKPVEGGKYTNIQRIQNLDIAFSSTTDL